MPGRPDATVTSGRERGERGSFQTATRPLCRWSGVADGQVAEFRGRVAAPKSGSASAIPAPVGARNPSGRERVSPTVSPFAPHGSVRSATMPRSSKARAASAFLIPAESRSLRCQRGRAAPGTAFGTIKSLNCQRIGARLGPATKRQDHVGTEPSTAVFGRGVAMTPGPNRERK